MKDKALQQLRQQYKEYLTIEGIHESIAYTYYEGAKYFAIEIGLLTAQEIETMETEQEDLIGRKE